VDATAGEAGDDRLAFYDALSIFYQRAVVIVHQGIAAVQYGEGRERGELTGEGCLAVTQGAEATTLGASDADVERGEALASDGGARDDILAQEPDGELLEFVGEAAMPGAPLRFHAEGEVIYALMAAAKLIALEAENGVDADTGEGVGGLHDAIARGAEKTVVEGVDAIGDVVERRGD